MNKKIYLLPLLLLAFVFTSCEENEEVGKYDNWRARNEAFIDSLFTVYTTQPDHGGLDSIHLITDPSAYIFYKKKTPVVPEGEEPVIKKISPLYTQYVTYYSKGSNIIGYVDKTGNFIGEVFAGNFDGVNPNINFSPIYQSAVYYLTNLQNNNGGNIEVVGSTEILQRMKVGERWEYYVPWQFGYGSSNSNSKGVLGYSTLIYDLQLLGIVGNQ